MSQLETSSSVETLAGRRDALRQAQPGLRARDLAARLGVSEAELLECEPTAARLRPDWQALLAALPSLGRVMALTRNEAVVHEKKGIYPELRWSPHASMFLGPDIDLRIFPGQWASAFAAQEESARGWKRSVQVFDATGAAVHKVHLLPDSDVSAFERLIVALGDSQPAPLAPAPRPAPPAPAAVERAAFQAGWDALQDTHEFHGLLKKFGLGRLEALREARPDQARLLADNPLRGALESAAASELPIMVFVGNPGCIQIHTGPVRNVRVVHGWTNVLDPDFNLHINDALLGPAYRVSKPTRDGPVTSLEIFDGGGALAVQLFGARKPGNPEDPAWRALAESLA